MGQLDNKYLPDVAPVVDGSGNAPKPWREIVSGDPSVTSRDDIINPYAVVNPRDYALTRKGRMQYEADLARVIEFQKQQEASYEEWYNSPEQAAIRERAAGMNPDLVGLNDAGEASQVAPSDVVPGQNLPTNGEVALNVISGITGIIGSLSSVASLATAFSTLSLTAEQTKNAKKVGEQLGLQNELLGLQNEDKLGSMLASDISDFLATAQQAHIDSNAQGEFDLEGFFANDANFEALRAIYGSNPRFESQLAKQRKAVLAHQKRAAESQSDLASANWSLSNVLADPRYTPDQRLTILQLQPYMSACVAADSAEVHLREVTSSWNAKRQQGMSVESAIDAANAANRASIAQSGYTEAYYNEADGELVAAYEQYFRDCMMPGLELRDLINQGYVDMFNSDPSGEASWKAAYLYGSNGGSSWEEAFLIRQKDSTQKLLDSKIAVAQATGDYAELQAMVKALDSILTSASGSFWGKLSIDPIYFKTLTEFRKILMEQIQNVQ